MQLCNKQYVTSARKSSSSLSFKRALRESGSRIGYEPTKNELRSLSAVDIQGQISEQIGMITQPLGILTAEVRGTRGKTHRYPKKVEF